MTIDDTMERRRWPHQHIHSKHHYGNRPWRFLANMYVASRASETSAASLSRSPLSTCLEAGVLAFSCRSLGQTVGGWVCIY